MAYIEIHNIGPLRDIKLYINKINLFIGPQSSGKSTIAKITSFCLWLEKDVLIHQDYQYIDSDFIELNLLQFHKLKNYIQPDSSIKFEGEAIFFEYSPSHYHITRAEGFTKAQVSKIAYIPAERNVISLPGIPSLPFPFNNIRSFIFDWLNMHSKYDKENAIPMLDLKMKYYYQESTKKDLLVLENGKEIGLDEASSGMQSVVPLYVYLNYLTHWIYQNSTDISFEKKSILEQALNKIVLSHTVPQEVLREPGMDALFKSKEITAQTRNLFDSIHAVEKERILDDDKLRSLLNIESNITKVHYSNIIIEEPELNLFPQTQITLIYDIMKLINKQRDNLVITTHSPYILYALNNCMLGSLVKNNIPEEDEELQAMSASWIHPTNVSVWEIKDGMFYSPFNNPNQTIQDAEGLIRNNYFDRIMKGVMSDFNSLISYYNE